MNALSLYAREQRLLRRQIMAELDQAQSERQKSVDESEDYRPPVTERAGIFIHSLIHRDVLQARRQKRRKALREGFAR